MALRWGIAGASKISHDFCGALNSNLTPTEHKIVAIASRSKELATDFAKQHNIPNSYGSYDALGRNANVEVVYIAVLNPNHFKVSKLMIEYGKHVVCEKPMAMNQAQVKELHLLASKYRVFLMEGLWSRFFPVYRHLSRLICCGSLGDIKEIYIKHGFNGCGNGRIERKDMGGGIVLDIGCYAIQFVLFVFRDSPKEIIAKGKVNGNGVDMYFEAELIFSEGRKANIICSGLEELTNQATIITTKGPICIPQYWCPTQYICLGAMHQWNLINLPIQMNFTNSVGLKYEADEVSKCIRGGKLICNIVHPEQSVAIAKIQDEIRKQIGVHYESDKEL